MTDDTEHGEPTAGDLVAFLQQNPGWHTVAGYRVKLHATYDWPSHGCRTRRSARKHPQGHRKADES